MSFTKYIHLERLNNEDVLGITNGECYIFPKLDGTNASAWIEEGEIKGGSRNRELLLNNDNGGFLSWLVTQDNIKQYLLKYPNRKLFGEWLIPHSLKTYRKDAWRNFYVFDVLEENSFLHYSDYVKSLEDFNIDYIPPISIIRDPDETQLYKSLQNNTFLIEDNSGHGEGIVIKNYHFVNKYHRTVWAKLISNEFKEKHILSMGTNIINTLSVEKQIVDTFVTKSFCEKEFNKIKLGVEWSSPLIPRLLNTVYFELVKEEAWEFVKKHKDPIINFKSLKQYTFNKVKELMPELF